MINLQNVKAKNGSAWHTICPFPVGFVYSSYTNTSPGSTFGGTWSSITGRFPYFNAGTGTGGSNTHTLSVQEMPSHRHNAYGRDAVSEASGAAALNVPHSSQPNLFKDRLIVNGATTATQATGGGSAHNNMPAYQTLYAWRRTA